MHAKPHLIIFSTAFFPHVGGAEMAVQAVIPFLVQTYECTVVTAKLDPSLPRETIFEGARVIRLGCGIPWLDKLLLIFFGWWQVRLIAQKKQVCGVWAIMASYAGAAAFLTRIFLRIPYALTLQEGDDLAVVNRRTRWAHFLFRRIFTEANGIQTIASFLSVWARSFGQLKRIPVVIPNGVTVSAFHITSAERALWRTQVRQQLQIPTDASVVLTVSRLVTKNGIADLIAAALRMPAVHFIIVGEGPLQPELERAAVPASTRIHFVGNALRADILSYASAADLFCRPSFSEGQGIVFLEAMAMELPIVATTVGGIPETVVPGTGVLVPPHEPLKLAAALEDLLQHEEKRNALVRTAAVHVQKFDWHSLAPQIVTWLCTSLQSI